MKKELQSGILSADKSADGRPSVGGANVIAVLQTICVLSLVMRKPAFCICENKDADQLCGNRTTDQRLCFRYIDSTIPLLSIYQLSSL